MNYWILHQIGEKNVYGPPPVGRLIARDDCVYRVIETLPGQMIVRPEGDPAAPGELIAVEEQEWWRILPEHHAVCAHCGEPMPCRRLRELSQATAELRRAKRLMSIPEGACWSCEKPISSRQKSVTFPGENLTLPVGPPAMFHVGILECRMTALDYQRKWVKAEAGREPILGVHDSYSGKPNATQRRLLAMAAGGELRCYMQRVIHAKPGDDITHLMTNPDHSEAIHHYVPCALPRRIEQHVHPLLDAGLLAEPIPEHLGYHEASYKLTDEGWATHRKYPAPSSSKETP